MRKRYKKKAVRPNGTKPGTLPSGIAKRLNALTARTLHVSWMKGVLWVLVVLCGLALVQGTLDWMFDLSRSARAFLLITDFLILGSLGYRFGILPWKNRLSPEDAALVAERHWPHLQTSLISGVQLARQPDGSPSLVEAMLEKLGPRVLKLDLRTAVSWNRLKRLGITTGVLLLVTSGLTVWLAPKSLILLQRILLFNIPLPTETIVIAVSDNFSLPTGQTIELSARASGVVPRSGRVEVTYAGKPPEVVNVSPKASTPDVFSLQLANVQQPLTYRFYLNDGRGEVFNVELLHPPVMQEIAFEVVPPAYTELPTTQLAPGSLTLLAGSKLRISGTSSQPLKSARLVLTGNDQSLELKPEGADRTEFQTEIPVTTEGLDGLWIELWNDEDVPSQNNTLYTVQILQDKPPVITLKDNQPDKLSLVPSQKPRLQFSVRDDFKVTEIFLCVQTMNTLGEGEVPSPENAKSIVIPVPTPAAGMATDFEWADPEKTVEWAEGTTLTYWIKAVDNNNVTGPGITYSEPKQWSVVSLQTKREELAEQLGKHAESIKDLSGVQESLRGDLGEILKQEDKKE